MKRLIYATALILPLIAAAACTKTKQEIKQQAIAEGKARYNTPLGDEIDELIETTGATEFRLCYGWTSNGTRVKWIHVLNPRGGTSFTDDKGRPHAFWQFSNNFVDGNFISVSSPDCDPKGLILRGLTFVPLDPSLTAEKPTFDINNSFFKSPSKKKGSNFVDTTGENVVIDPKTCKPADELWPEVQCGGWGEEASCEPIDPCRRARGEKGATIRTKIPGINHGEWVEGKGKKAVNR